MNRTDKLEMIKRLNPDFRDLYSTLFDSGQARMTVTLDKAVHSYEGQDDGIQRSEDSPKRE